MSTTNPQNQNKNIDRSFFSELLEKDDVKAVGYVLKNIYDTIQMKKKLLPGEANNALLKLAEINAKTTDLHNWLLYKYGSGSLADHHLEIVKRVMDGDIEELNAIENIVHISNQTRGIREVDEFFSEILYGKPNSYHRENFPVKEGDIQDIHLSVNRNMVNQNNLTDPKNILRVQQRGVNITPVINPHQASLIEQMNGVENTIKHILTPREPYKTTHKTVSVRSLN